jgi:hypothetical protein
MGHEGWLRRIVASAQAAVCHIARARKDATNVDGKASEWQSHKKTLKTMSWKDTCQP